MTTTLSAPALDRSATRIRRAGWLLFLLGLAGAGLTITSNLMRGPQADALGLFTGVLWTAYSGLCGVSLLLGRRGRQAWAAGLILAGPLAIVPLTSLMLSGLGFTTGLALAVLVALAANYFDLPRPQLRLAVAGGIVMGLLTLGIDYSYTGPRAPAPALWQALAFGLLGLLGLLYAVITLRQFRSYSLRTKLTAGFVMVAVAAAGLVTFATDWAVRAQLTETVGANLKSHADAQASAMGELMARQVDLLDSLSRNRLLQDRLRINNALYSEARIQADLQARDQQWRAADAANNDNDPLVRAVLRNAAANELLEFRKAFPDHVEVFVTDKYGGNVAATNRTSDYYQADEPWWQAAYNNGQGAVYIGQPEFDESAGTYATNIALPVYDRTTHKLIGVLRTTARQEALLHVLASARMGQTGNAELLLPGSQLLNADGQIQVLDTTLAAQVEAAAQRTFAQVDLRGVPRLVSQAPVATLNAAAGDAVRKLGWRVVIDLDPAEALAPVAAAERTTLLAALVVLLVAAAVAVIAARSISGPIGRLTAVAERVRAGDLTAHAQVDSADEIGTLAGAFNTMTTRLRDLIGSLETRVGERTAQAQAAADIGRATTQIRNLDELLRQTINLVRDRFPAIYQVSVFLADESGRSVVLRDSTGEVGAILRASGYALEIGSQSFIGWVTANRRARVAADVDEDPYYLKHPLLPETRAEAVIPLIVGDNLLGVLDVQSRETNAFSPALVQVLQTVADQLSVAIENAQLFQHAQASLAEVSSLYQQVIGGGWQQLAGGQARELVYNLASQAEAPGSGAADQSFSLEIRLRGQVIGTMQLYGRSESDLADDERVILESVAAQLGVALEGAVLFEESQRRTRREKLINQIADQMRATLNQTSVMQNGIRELGRALGASEVVVRLTPAGARRLDASEGKEE